MLYCAGFYNGFNIAGCQRAGGEELYNVDKVGPFRMQTTTGSVLFRLLGLSWCSAVFVMQLFYICVHFSVVTRSNFFLIKRKKMHKALKTGNVFFLLLILIIFLIC